MTAECMEASSRWTGPLKTDLSLMDRLAIVTAPLLVFSENGRPSSTSCLQQVPQDIAKGKVGIRQPYVIRLALICSYPTDIFR